MQIKLATVPPATILIASKRTKLCFVQVMTNSSPGFAVKIAEPKKNSHYGITRKVKDLASPDT